MGLPVLALAVAYTLRLIELIVENVPARADTSKRNEEV